MEVKSKNLRQPQPDPINEIASILAQGIIRDRPLSTFNIKEIGRQNSHEVAEKSLEISADERD